MVNINYLHKCVSVLLIIFLLLDRKVSGKSKDEQMAEKKQELEKRLQDVSGQLGTHKKQQQKKGKYSELCKSNRAYTMHRKHNVICYYYYYYY